MASDEFCLPFCFLLTPDVSVELEWTLVKLILKLE